MANLGVSKAHVRWEKVSLGRNKGLGLMEKWRAIDSGMGLDRRSISHESILHQGRFRADGSFILCHVGEKWRRGRRSTHKPSSFASRWMTTIKSDVLSLILAPFCIINLTRTPARLYSISRLDRGVQRDAGKEREARSEIRKDVLKAFAQAEKEKRAPLREMFEDVYDELSEDSKAERRELGRILDAYPHEYNVDEFEGGRGGL